MLKIMMLIILSPFEIVSGIISIMIIYALLKKVISNNNKEKEDNKC